MQIFAPNQWIEAMDSCGWIGGKMEEVEEEGDPVGGQAVSIYLEPLRFLKHWITKQVAYTS